MKTFAKSITIGLAGLIAVVLLGVPQAFAAKASFDQPPGEPPYGLAVQGDAKGTKLYGVIIVEYFNIDSSLNANFRVVARLRKAGNDETFYASGGANTVNIVDPLQIQTTITPLLQNQILSYFFPGQTGLCAVLKSVDDLDRTPEQLLYASGLAFDVADVELAVNSCTP